jgi:hypothetical protein
LVAHLVGGLAADVIAFEQHLAASASAHHAMAQVFEARGIVSGSHEEEDGGGEDEGVEQAGGLSKHGAKRCLRAFALSG